MRSRCTSHALLALWVLPLATGACGARVSPIVDDVLVRDAAETPDSSESVVIEDPPDSCPAGTWCWHSPSPQGRPIYAVFATSDSEAWAVGQQGTVMRYREGRWSAQPAISPATLSNVWGAGSDCVWAWGARPEPGGASDVVVWDGAQWSRPPASNSAPLLDLHGSARDNVWLSRGNPSTSSFIHRWNGSAFVPVVALPDRRQPSSICVRSATEAWATATDTGSAAARHIYRFDGATWTRAHSIAPNERFSSKIACPMDGVALVEQRTSDETVTFVEIRGSTVNQGARPLSGQAEFARTPHGDAFFVSEREAARWTPSGWQRAFTAGPDRALSSTFDLPPRGSSGWMANGTPFLATLSAGSWSADPQWRFLPLSVFPAVASEVDAIDPSVVFGNLVWALRVTRGWQIARSLALPSMLRFDAHRAWGASANTIWVVGARGAIARYDGRTRQLSLATIDAPVGAADLYAVHGSDESNVWAVGSGGTILRLRGDRWIGSPMPFPEFLATSRPSNVQFDFVHVADENDVLISGPDTTRVGTHVTVQWNGAAWITHTQNAPIARDQQRNWYSFDNASLIRRAPNSAQWTRIGAAPELPVRRLRVRPSGTIEAFASNGRRSALYELDSMGRFNVVGAPLEGDGVLDIVRGANNSLWAAGAYGSILRYEPRR